MADVHKAAAVALDAEQEWAALPYTERSAVLAERATCGSANAEEITGWRGRDRLDRPLSPVSQIMTSAQECYEAAALASAPYGELLAREQPRLSMSRRVPVGVVGVISPFNVPTILGIRSVAPALALGNAVLLKPDPRTAVSGGVVAGPEIFARPGCPTGCCTCCRAARTSARRWSRSRWCGWSRSPARPRPGGVVAARAQHLKRVHLELGGNSALLVLDDVDIDAASSVGGMGVVRPPGPGVHGHGRHLVQTGIADAYRRRACRPRRPAAGRRPDDGSGGARAGHRRRPARQDSRACHRTSDAGARLAAGGTYEELFYRPTVLADVPTTAPAYTEEIFGPVAPVVRFDTMDEAVRLARETPYGLSLGILTRDVMRGLEIAERIPSGLVHINDQTVNDEANIPFGGVKESGTGGRLGGAAANLEAFTDTQWITVRGTLPAYPI